MAAKTLIAKTSFVAEVKGEQLHVHAGQRVASNDPLVKGRESLFEQARDVDVETPQRGRPRSGRKV